MYFIFKHILIFFRTITGEARDALVELIMKNCKYDELNWAEICLKGNTNNICWE